MTVRRISAQEALDDWSFYERMMNKVMRRAHVGTSAEDVLTCVQLGRMQIWRSECGKGIAITELQTYPQYTVLLIYMVAGEDVRDWLKEGHKQLDSFAQQSGCKYVEFIGRPGWERMLTEDYGYTEKFIRMRREVNAGRRESDRAVRGDASDRCGEALNGSPEQPDIDAEAEVRQSRPERRRRVKRRADLRQPDIRKRRAV